MIHTTLRACACVGIAIGFSVSSGAQDHPATPPTAPGAEREFPAPVVQVRGAEPRIYQLGMPLGNCTAIDVDESGRIHVLDPGRQAVVRFNADGSLDKLWADGIHDSVWFRGRGGMKVSTGERLFLAPTDECRNVRRIGPGEADDQTFAALGHGWNLMPTGDGGYFIDVRAKYDMRDKAPIQLLRFSADGRQTGELSMEHAGASLIGPDGLIYMNSADQALVRVYDLAGKQIRSITLPALPEEDPTRVYGITSVDRNGDLYSHSQDGIYRFDATGKPLALWNLYKNADDAGKPHTLQVRGMSVRNGLVYVLVMRSPTNETPLDQCTWEIHAYSPDGQCVTRYVSVRHFIDMPVSIAVEPDGTYAVNERGTGRGSILDPAGRRYDLQPIPGTLSTVVAKPGGGFMANGGATLYAFDSTGQNQQKLFEDEPRREKCYGIWQFCVDPATGDTWGLGGWGVLTHLAADGKVVKVFPENEQLNFRTFSVGMAMDRKGMLYLSNACGHCVVQVNREGVIVRKTGREGSGAGELKYPEGLVLDAQDRLYVADSGNSRIQVFDATGNPLGCYGRRGSGKGEFDRPYGIAIASNQTLWVADTFNDRIVRIPLTDFWKAISTGVKP